MSKITQRRIALSPDQQREFILNVIPGRISVIEYCLKDCHKIDPLLAAAAIHTRALAGFIGIGVRRRNLIVDEEYWNHGDGSFEVKIKDIGNGELFTLAELTQLSTADKEAIIQGFHTTNLEFAHLTYWNDPSNQDTIGGPTASYRGALTARVRAFAESIIRLVRVRMPAIP